MYIYKYSKTPTVDRHLFNYNNLKNELNALLGDIYRYIPNIILTVGVFITLKIFIFWLRFYKIYVNIIIYIIRTFSRYR